MNRKCVLYKGVWLDPNSKGYELYQNKKLKELDAHMKECADKAYRLENPSASNSPGKP